MFERGKDIREARKAQTAEKERQRGLEILRLLRLETGREKENKRIKDLFKQNGVKLPSEATDAIFDGGWTYEHIGRLEERERVKYLLRIYNVHLPLDVAEEVLGDTQLSP